MSKGLQIALGGALVAALLGWYGASQVSEGGFVYYQTLGEFRTAGEPGRPARVHGFVVPGSIERDVAGKQVSFRVQETAPHAGGSAEGALPVIYASLETPDLFKDGAEVVVEGELAAAAGTFHASNVLAKCPSKFEGQQAEASL
jgi:cytochrome c-type biogenesis protein CcmE